MLIVNHEECTDNIVSYQFHVQSRNTPSLSLLKSVIYMFGLKLSRGTFVPKMRFLQKEKLFTNYLRNNIRFTFTILTAVCCRKRILS